MEEEKSDRFQLSEKVSKLTELQLPLSAHLIGGWYGNFERIKRFFKLYLQESEGVAKLDFGLSFFIFSYHLKEWIQIYEQIDKDKYNEKWKQFVKDFPEIKISRDICNVSKHLKIDSESFDKNFRLFWEHDPFIEETDWIIFYGNNREKLKELMRRVLNAWGYFIVDYLKIA